MSDENKILTGGELLSMYNECLLINGSKITWDNFNNTLFQGALENENQCIYNNKTVLPTAKEFWIKLRGYGDNQQQYAYVGAPIPMNNLLPFNAIQENKLIAKQDIKDPKDYFLEMPNKNQHEFTLSFGSSTIQNSFKISVSLNSLAQASEVIYFTNPGVTVNNSSAYTTRFDSYTKVLGTGGQLILSVTTTGITSMTNIEATIHTTTEQFAKVKLVTGTTTSSSIGSALGNITKDMLPQLADIRSIVFSGSFIGTSADEPTLPEFIELDTINLRIHLNPVRSVYATDLSFSAATITTKTGMDINILYPSTYQIRGTISGCTIQKDKIIFPTSELIGKLPTGTSLLRVPYYINGMWISFLIAVELLNASTTNPTITLYDPECIALLIDDSQSSSKFYIQNNSEDAVSIGRGYEGIYNIDMTVMSRQSDYLSNHMTTFLPHILYFQSSFRTSYLYNSINNQKLGDITMTGSVINIIDNSSVTTWQQFVNLVGQKNLSLRIENS